MRLKTKKLILCSAILGIGVSMFSVSASALSFSKYGVKEWNGIINDQAFAWTGTTQTSTVNATVVNSSNWATIVTRTENDGHVQTPQVTYRKASVMGMHSGQKGSSSISARSWP